MNQKRQFTQVLRSCVLGVGAVLSFGASGSTIKADVLYHEYCSVCHGDRGDGNSRAMKSLNPPPRDLTKAGAALPRDYILHVITHGKPNTAMQSFKQLTNVDIAAVLTFTRNSWGNKASEVQPADVKARRK